ncbi:hypothetical protein [Shimia haliotis]|uniref:Sulfotransferase family protein n=1 Tax=Shimia haliotis TaxID=1280847 RepID=A0A1I4C1M6_9RHOB|nr:hypothetical protein [Shimia haliotis]SFK75004.1 hypothetical protein SAMN04488036_1025 [Shimia haliotis]
MIICHPLKLIFIKTKKTAGTSLEIALSKFCGPDCVITPIATEDELIRQERAGRSAQNHLNQKWPDGTTSDRVFFNHMTAPALRRLVPTSIWSEYKKITIVRDPYDAAISRYWWEGGDASGLDFGRFADLYRVMLGENDIIAPLDGTCDLDVYLRYEHLEDEIKALKIDGLWQEFSGLRAKSTQRPSKGTTVADTYAAFPSAAEMVRDECAETIARFAYPSPAKAPTGPATSQVRNKPLIFALSAGRTGTAWLAELLDQNLNIPAIHEPLHPSDFGTKMPDIRIMREFNSYGLTRHVRGFWKNKLAELPDGYAETNHTLGKCGLIESLAESDLADRATVVILRRNLVDQCASYILRDDFGHATQEWQWYLSPRYRNALVDSTAFLSRGAPGHAMWYCFEMEARYAYYKRAFQDRIRFVDAMLEPASTPKGAQTLLADLGYGGLVTLPEKTNATTSQAEALARVKEQIAPIINSVQFDADAIADTYIRGGKKLSLI